MARYEVELILARSVTVEVQARNAEEARDVAADRSKWLSSRGMRSRLRLLATMIPRRV